MKEGEEDKGGTEEAQVKQVVRRVGDGIGGHLRTLEQSSIQGLTTGRC